MADLGTNGQVVKIRLIGRANRAEPLAGKIVDLLEANGYTVLEWSRAFPCRSAEEAGLSRIYVGAIKEGEHEKDAKQGI